MEIKAIYIGDEFYRESGTRMAHMMLEDGSRFCIGDIPIELRKGNTVSVRPATDAELGRAHKMLKAVRKKLPTLG